MALPFFIPKRETSATIRAKAERLLAQAMDFPQKAQGRFSSGDNRLKRAGREGDFRQFRDYNDSDRPQDIDWKRSGRSDDILVREREKNQRRQIDLYIQNDAGMNFHSNANLWTKHEAAAVLGTAFSLWAKHKHDTVSYRGQKINADEISHLILDEKNTPPFQAKINAITILIGDFVAPIAELEQKFSALPSKDVLLLQVFDPAELELPYKGRAIFENGTDSPAINNVDSVRGDYQSNLNTHLDALKDYARKRNWYYDLIRTDLEFISHFNRAIAAIEDAA